MARHREEREESGCQQTCVGIHQREIVLSERVGSWIRSSSPCSDRIQAVLVKRSSLCQEMFSAEGVEACQSNDEPVVSQGKALILISLLNSSANSSDAQQMSIRQLAPTLETCVNINAQIEKQIDAGNEILMEIANFLQGHII